MASLKSQLNELKKRIVIPWRMVFVDEEIKPENFEEKTIYVHIWI